LRAYIIVEVRKLFLRGKRELKVDMSELKGENENLSSFLRSKLNVDVASRGNKLHVDSETIAAKELKRVVNKFVYHQNLNHKYWVGLEGNVVKINRFKHSKKREENRGTTLSTIKHGW
jgi:phosphate starvation-inducible protein PhoH